MIHATKVIFDTDPGIDDTMAMILAHASNKIDLMGMTTVFGNASIENATRNALLVKKMFGLSADVAKGADTPLEVKAGEQRPLFTVTMGSVTYHCQILSLKSLYLSPHMTTSSIR